RRRVVGAQFNAVATANGVLLEVAELYLDLLGAEAALEMRRMTGAEGDDIAQLTLDYAVTGQGAPPDAERADVERRLLQLEIQRGEEQVAVASARLSQRLNLDPSTRLRTLATALAPFRLIDASAPTEDLIAAALGRRPELRARSAQVAYAEMNHREELA